jgi:hypothetical protein
MFVHRTNMSTAAPVIRQGQLDQLRVELVELAFTLECRGRLDAADLALAVAARLEELNTGTPAEPSLVE